MHRDLIPREDVRLCGKCTDCNLICASVCCSRMHTFKLVKIMDISWPTNVLTRLVIAVWNKPTIIDIYIVEYTRVVSSYLLS